MELRVRQRNRILSMACIMLGRSLNADESFCCAKPEASLAASLPIQGIINVQKPMQIFLDGNARYRE